MQFSSNWRYCRRLLTLYKKKLLILPLEFLADLSKTVQEEACLHSVGSPSRSLPLCGYLCLQMFTPRELSFRGLDKTHKSAKLTFLPIETLCIFVFLSFCIFVFLSIVISTNWNYLYQTQMEKEALLLKFTFDVAEFVSCLRGSVSESYYPS